MNNGVPWSTPRMNPTHFNFDDDAFIEAVQFYADLANKHKVAPNASEVQSMSTPDLFAVGQGGDRAGWPLAIPDIHPSRRPGFRCHPVAGRAGAADGAARPLQYRYHRTGHLGEQPTQGTGVGIREVRDRPRRAGD